MLRGTAGKILAHYLIIDLAKDATGYCCRDGFNGLLMLTEP